MKKYVQHFPKKREEVINIIKMNTGKYHLIELWQSEKWVSNFTESKIMIGKYYFSFGLIRCLYANIFSENNGCKIEGEFRMFRGYRNTMILLLILGWSFIIYMTIVDYRYTCFQDYISMIVSNPFLHLVMIFTCIMILLFYIVEHRDWKSDNELSEFLNDILLRGRRNRRADGSC